VRARARPRRLKRRPNNVSAAVGHRSSQGIYSTGRLSLRFRIAGDEVRPGFARLLFITAFSTASSLMFNAPELVNTPTKSPPRCPGIARRFFSVLRGLSRLLRRSRASVSYHAEPVRARRWLPNYYFRNTRLSLIFSPVPNVPVVVSVICCPSVETTQRS